MLPACDMKAEGSIKSITKPYIAQYECTEARFGNINILEQYEFIKIIILDKDQLEVNIKPKNGEKKSARCAYTLDPETRTLSAEVGILGYKFKESVVVKNGQFTISKIIGSKEFFVKFEVE